MLPSEKARRFRTATCRKNRLRLTPDFEVVLYCRDALWLHRNKCCAWPSAQYCSTVAISSGPQSACGRPFRRTSRCRCRSLPRSREQQAHLGRLLATISPHARRLPHAAWICLAWRPPLVCRQAFCRESRALSDRSRLLLDVSPKRRLFRSSDYNRGYQASNAKSEDSSMAKIRVVAIADTHGEHNLIRVPDGDILLHAGDFALRNNFEHLQSGLKWFASQPHSTKIFIGGNHDHAIEAKHTFSPWEKQHQESIKQQIQEYTQKRSVIYLEHQTKDIVVNGRKLRVFGSPFTLWHGPGAWRYDRKEDIWRHAIQAGTDLVIVHGPFGMLDRNRHGQPCGCKHLMTRLEQVQPALAVFGHMHEGFGQQVCTWPSGKKTTFANVAKGFPGQFPERNSAVTFQL